MDYEGKDDSCLYPDRTGQQWLRRYRGCSPVFACIFGFTQTGLIPGISAAGATPEARQYTAIADAEFYIMVPNHSPNIPATAPGWGISSADFSRHCPGAGHSDPSV
jgi:NaMN:DMB phosphoribosyltransferase